MVIVIGAGIGGLVAAVELAAQGLPTLVLERQPQAGGKIRQVGGIDAGPTVFTMRWVFEEIFARAGTALAAELPMRRAHILARHAWNDRGYLDLFADIAESADAIGRFAGAREADGFRAFCARAKEIYQTLEKPFLRAKLPTPVSLATGAGLAGLPQLLRISPFDTMMKALTKYFADPRLLQLFGRYATYCGSSPYLAPATLMLVAHVEQDGVWLLEGGMIALPEALARVLTRLGGTLRCGAGVARIETDGGGVCAVVLESGERLEAGAVIVNADAAALAAGCFGEAVRAAVPAASRDTRSQSAVTWSMTATTSGFPLTRHGVFFSGDYAAEFRDVFGQNRVPGEPTVYVCAQDRVENEATVGAERLLLLINAPANGDTKTDAETEIAQWTERMTRRIETCGLRLAPETQTVTTPARFARLFPATGGALYGQAVHGAMATFRRPGAATKIPGLYLAGGSVHPGAGVPMAALSGVQAARAVVQAGGSMRR